MSRPELTRIFSPDLDQVDFEYVQIRRQILRCLEARGLLDDFHRFADQHRKLVRPTATFLIFDPPPDDRGERHAPQPLKYN